jgi:ubiquitin-conjugating enzyme E2 variant
MSNLHIEQHDAKKLAAGYKKSFRVIEIFAILTFWSLSAGIAYRTVPFAKTHPWVVVAAVMAGFIFADFVSGFVHWMADTWGSADMPVLGKSLVRPFREHHVDQKAMTKHDYVETNGANCLVSLPVAGGVFAIPLDVTSSWFSFSLFSFVSIGSMVFFVMWTNQIHKWSHLEPEETPSWLKVLQKLHIVLPPEHHQIHHKAPYDTHYCITTGWLNWPLAKIGFYRHLERFWTALTGLVPRKDDIGLKAALQIAPLVLEEKQPEPKPQKA